MAATSPFFPSTIFHVRQYSSELRDVQQTLPDLFDKLFLGNLFAIAVQDIKHLHHLIGAGADLGPEDVDLEISQGTADGVGNAWLVGDIDS